MTEETKPTKVLERNFELSIEFYIMVLNYIVLNLEIGITSKFANKCELYNLKNFNFVLTSQLTYFNSFLHARKTTQKSQKCKSTIIIAQ